jgi:hypothetical protein
MSRRNMPRKLNLFTPLLLTLLSLISASSATATITAPQASYRELSVNITASVKVTVRVDSKILPDLDPGISAVYLRAIGATFGREDEPEPVVRLITFSWGSLPETALNKSAHADLYDVQDVKLVKLNNDRVLLEIKGVMVLQAMSQRLKLRPSAQPSESYEIQSTSMKKSQSILTQREEYETY